MFKEHYSRGIFNLRTKCIEKFRALKGCRKLPHICPAKKYPKKGSVPCNYMNTIIEREKRVKFRREITNSKRVRKLT